MTKTKNLDNVDNLTYLPDTQVTDQRLWISEAPTVVEEPVVATLHRGSSAESPVVGW